MDNVKETIIEGVNNAMVYQVFAGEDEHLHLALFDGSITKKFRKKVLTLSVPLRLCPRT